MQLNNKREIQGSSKALFEMKQMEHPLLFASGHCYSMSGISQSKTFLDPEPTLDHLQIQLTCRVLENQSITF